jgi:small multidrug resistance pump
MLSTEFILLILLVVAVEACSWACIKTFTITGQRWLLGLASLGYFLNVLCLSKMTQSEGMGITNALWNILSTIVVAALGILVFSEPYSWTTLCGFALGIVGILLLNF